MIKAILIFTLLEFSTTFATGTFAKHDANLQQLQGKIFSDEKSIVDLIKEKNETTDIAKIHEIVAEIKKLIKSRRENIEKFNKEYYHIEYEHPGKMNSHTSGGKKVEEKKGEVPAVTLKNRYKRYDEKSIKEFEDEINKTLSDVYDNVKKKYNSNKEK